jgi:hypothetical protein
MKNLIAKFADAMLSKESMKAVKGGNFYCKCDENGPVPNPNNDDCMYVCFGINQSHGNLGPTNGPGAPTTTNTWQPPTPCTFSISFGGNTVYTWNVWNC